MDVASRDETLPCPLRISRVCAMIAPAPAKRSIHQKSSQTLSHTRADGMGSFLQVEYVRRTRVRIRLRTTNNDAARPGLWTVASAAKPLRPLPLSSSRRSRFRAAMPYSLPPAAPGRSRRPLPAGTCTVRVFPSAPVCRTSLDVSAITIRAGRSCMGSDSPGAIRNRTTRIRESSYSTLAFSGATATRSWHTAQLAATIAISVDVAVAILMYSF
jgi:hypothetical protein